MKITPTRTWASMKVDKMGTIYRDITLYGLRCLIMRGPCSLCAYIGIPLDHILANKGYDDVPLAVHGGLTYASAGDGSHFPAGLYWYGWDYAHFGDAPLYDPSEGSWGLQSNNDKKWLVEDVEKELKKAAKDFIRLLNLRGYHASGSTEEVV